VEPPTRHRETAKPTSTPPAAWSLIRRAHQLCGDHGLTLVEPLVIARLLHIARAVADTAILEGEVSTLSG
jgi:hypothetical protein